MSNKEQNHPASGAGSSASERAGDRGFWGALNREATIIGGLRSSIGHTKDAVRLVKGSAGQVLGASAIGGDGRIESFDQAMARLGVDDDGLPLIHNQIVLQAYVGFFVGLVAMAFGVNYLVDGQLAAGSLASIVALAGWVLFAQSSAQTLQIRRRKLGLLGSWFLQPGEWFPSRIEGLRQMERSDPLRSAEAVNPIAKKSRAWLFSAAALSGAGFALEAATAGYSVGHWGLLTLAAGIFCLAFGASASFEVFRRRKGVHCDVGLWLLSPGHWIPSRDDREVAKGGE